MTHYTHNFKDFHKITLSKNMINKSPKLIIQIVYFYVVWEINQYNKLRSNEDIDGWFILVSDKFMWSEDIILINWRSAGKSNITAIQDKIELISFWPEGLNFENNIVEN